MEKVPWEGELVLNIIKLYCVDIPDCQRVNT